MIIVKIELHSALTGEVTEIGRMRVANTGEGTKERGEYLVKVMRRGTIDVVRALGVVSNHPRLSASVWSLVRKAIESVKL